MVPRVVLQELPLFYRVFIESGCNFRGDGGLASPFNFWRRVSRHGRRDKAVSLQRMPEGHSATLGRINQDYRIILILDLSIAHVNYCSVVTSRGWTIQLGVTHISGDSNLCQLAACCLILAQSGSYISALLTLMNQGRGWLQLIRVSLESALHLCLPAIHVVLWGLSSPAYALFDHILDSESSPSYRGLLHREIKRLL